MRIGVLAVQGNFREHAAMLRRLGAEVVEVRLPEELADLDGLVIPGGESTTITRLMRLYGLEEAIRRFDGAVFGTCAGMILLDRNHLGLVDLEVDRNAYGRQVASFEADLELGGRPLRGVFIRAPRVRDVGGMEVLAELNGEPVLLRQGRFLVASFHPELTDDTRVHERFLDLVREEATRLPGAALAKEASERGAGHYCQSTDKPRSRTILPPASSGGGGAGLRPAGAAAGQGGEDVRA
jgi:pyridoxal 5'-phosphate synthase pdxT subunit